MNNDSKRRTVSDWIIPVAALLLAIAVVLVLLREGGTPMDRLKVVAGYLILILVFFYGLIVLVAMVSGRIDFKYLVSESDGSASMSRFQLLIFTFIIGLSLFLIVVASNPPRFPEIPTTILTLLGISATTYAAGKAIQMSRTEPSNPPGGTAGGGGENTPRP